MHIIPLYRSVLHGIEVLHVMTLYRMVLHGIVLYLTVLHGIILMLASARGLYLARHLSSLYKLIFDTLKLTSESCSCTAYQVVTVMSGSLEGTCLVTGRREQMPTVTSCQNVTPPSQSTNYLPVKINEGSLTRF